MTLPNLFLMLLALVAGMSFVTQQAVNANLRAEIGSAWWAGFFSYLGGTVVMLAMILIQKEPLLAPQAAMRSSWWSWGGGLFGAIYIAISILLVPRLGVFTVVALIVIGQLTTSLFFDHFGLFNVPLHPVSLTRILGALFLVAGAILIRW